MEKVDMEKVKIFLHNPPGGKGVVLSRILREYRKAGYTHVVFFDPSYEGIEHELMTIVKF